MKYKKAKRIISLSALFLMTFTLLAAATVKAEWSENFVRVACLKKAGIMQIESSVQEDPTVQVNTQTPAENKHRHSLWAKEGFYTPDGSSHQCTISGNTFSFKASEQHEKVSGCSQGEVLRLSVSKNGQKIFDNIPLGGRCGGVPSISKISISATTASAPDEMLICTAPNGKTDSLNFVGEEVNSICAYYHNIPSTNAIFFPVTEKSIKSIENHALLNY